MPVLLGVSDASLTALGVAEVLDHLVRIAGADEEDATLDVAQLGLGTALPSTRRSVPLPDGYGPGTTTGRGAQ